MTGILFDLDGTLLDTLDDLADAVNVSLGLFHYPHRTREEVRRFVGNGAARLIQQAVPHGAEWEPVYREFQTFYQGHCAVKTAPYPGIMKALTVLRNEYPMAIVSNKPDGAVKKLCKNYFPGIFALGQSDALPRKPEPDMVFKAMEMIGVEDCIYVGDSEVDVLTAENANVPCLSVLWGFRDRAEIEKAGGAAFCGDVSELVPALHNMMNTRK